MFDVISLEECLVDLPAIDIQGFWGHRKVNQPTRPYLKPVAWIVEKDGMHQYPLVAVFPLSDGQLAHVPWDRKSNGFAFEQAHYVVNPDPALTATSPTGVNTLFDSEFDAKKRITLGKALPSAVWQSLRDAAEGPPAQDKSLKATPV